MVEHNLTVFTWNMARGRSIVPPNNNDGKVRAAARLKLLKYLCSKADVGFITEPGQDLIGAVAAPNTTSVLVPGGYGYWTAASRGDNQAQGHACRNLIFCKRKLTKEVPISFQSGGDNAYRHPAAGVLDLKPGRLMLITLHATSTYTAHGNVTGLTSFLDDHSKITKLADGVLIGGDFNCNNTEFLQPEDPTHGSSHTLDGFTHDIWDEGDSDWKMSFSFPYDAQVLKVADKYYLENLWDPTGYKVVKKVVNGTQHIPVSDHAPVWAEVRVQVDEKMDMS